MNFLGEVLSTVTIRQSSITFFGALINGALGALFYIILARTLGPDDFGRLAISVAVLTLITDIANLGTDTSLVKFVGQYLKDEKLIAYRFLKLILKLRLISGITMILLSFILAPIMAKSFFQKEELTGPLELAFWGVAGAQLLAFALSYFQALQRFWSWSLIQIGTNSFRLLVVCGLLIWLRLNLSSALSIYVVAPLLGFFVSLLFLPLDFLKVKNEKEVGPSLLNYSKWVSLSVMVTALSSRLDTFIAGRLLSPSEVGFYAAASLLCVIVPQIMRSLDTVIAPKMARLKSVGELKIFLIKTQLLTLCLFLLGLLVSPLVLILIPLIFGSAYATSVPLLFMILLIANLIFLISVPIHSAINYFFGYPRLFTYTSFLHLIVTALLGWWLISILGATGAALTVLIGMSLNFLIPAFWITFKLKQTVNGE